MWNMKMIDNWTHFSSVYVWTMIVWNHCFPHNCRGDVRAITFKELTYSGVGCFYINWEKFWHFIRLWRQRRWFVAWKCKILRSRSILVIRNPKFKNKFHERKNVNINLRFKLCEMSEYLLPGMTDFSAGSDASARFFRNIWNMKSQNRQNTSNQASNWNVISSMFVNKNLNQN